MFVWSSVIEQRGITAYFVAFCGGSLARRLLQAIRRALPARTGIDFGRTHAPDFGNAPAEIAKAERTVRVIRVKPPHGHNSLSKGLLSPRMNPCGRRDRRSQADGRQPGGGITRSAQAEGAAGNRDTRLRGVPLGRLGCPPSILLTNLDRQTDRCREIIGPFFRISRPKLRPRRTGGRASSAFQDGLNHSATLSAERSLGDDSCMSTSRRPGH